MYDVVVLSLPEGGGSEDACSSGGGCSGCGVLKKAVCGPRVPVLECADALTSAGARVEIVAAGSDAEIDEVLARFDGPATGDGLSRPDTDNKTRLVVAVTTDGQLRAIVRRMVRRYAPPPSKRPADLADGHTMFDLPPVAILPLDAGATNDLAAQLGLPRTPAEVAAALLDGPIRRLDLLRNDGGSVTLDGALIGGADDNGRAIAFRGRVEVDDAVLTDGEDAVMACVIGNAGGYAEFDGMRLLPEGNPRDGLIEVAVAVPKVVKRFLKNPSVQVEVRRARGRAASILPRDGELPFLDDGVAGVLGRKRSWWNEPGAWAVYASSPAVRG